MINIYISMKYDAHKFSFQNTIIRLALVNKAYYNAINYIETKRQSCIIYGQNRGSLLHPVTVV